MEKLISKILRFLKTIHKLVIDSIYPVECLSCAKSGEWLCDECVSKIKVRKDNVCAVCNLECFDGRVHKECLEHSFLDGLYVATSMKDNLIRKVIETYKYKFVKDLSEPLSLLLCKKIFNLTSNFDCVVFVPLHKRRMLWRGFDQAKELADRLGERMGLPVERRVVERIKYTSSQTKKDRRERLGSLTDAFIIKNIDKIKNKRVLLVDDVFTTGATMQEIAKVLKSCGAFEVWGLVVARG